MKSKLAITSFILSLLILVVFVFTIWNLITTGNLLISFYIYLAISILNVALSVISIHIIEQSKILSGKGLGITSMVISFIVIYFCLFFVGLKGICSTGSC